MAGRIRDDDIAAVRERSPIAEIVGDHVALRNAGGGNLKGLCPFHEEKSPSFTVSPGKNLFHCFGCGAGGDVIRFVERADHLSFTEAVEQLAVRSGIQLRYVEGGSAPLRAQGQRTRLVEAHALAAEYYAEHLRTPDARAAREFLAQRGFDAAAAESYGCGFAPAAWDGLVKHLQSRGYRAEELLTAGLGKETSRGSLIDRFHRRLLWPIRDVSGDVVGFGARRLFDDDKIEAKYLNTPETPIYKKSQLLYGMDRAKKEIARQHRAVIVEGYTDVMACHLAGVTTAVATCGTAFGSEHVTLLRRLLLDSDTFRGEVIFTFDGDAAGMRAAERAFGDDQKFMAQTFVAIEAEGRDPCELRLAGGDVAVRDLVARRIPLVEFVLRTTVGRLDLETAEGRAQALDAGVPLVARIKDHSLRDEYARRLAGLVGVDDPLRVVARVRGLLRGANGNRSRPGEGPVANGASGPRSRDEPGGPGPRRAPLDPAVVALEREVLKVAVQHPGLAGPAFDALEDELFADPAHRAVRRAIAAAGGTAAGAGGPATAWIARIEAELDAGPVRDLVPGLAVEALHTDGDSVERYADAVLARLQEIAIARRVSTLKSRLQRINPLEAAQEYGQLFTELIATENHRRLLRERAIGGAE
ncbi:MAG: DNA primase [bacterium]